MTTTVWEQCLDQLKREVPEQQFNTWIRPLQSQENDHQLILFAPNEYVLNHVNNQFLSRISEILTQTAEAANMVVDLVKGSASVVESTPAVQEFAPETATPNVTLPELKSNLNPGFTFDTFVRGASNELAEAAGRQVAENPGGSYNPLFIYGGVGLGKTHLMHAVGNSIKQANPKARILYLHSERFVTDMVKALQNNEMERFKQTYRTLDVLLVDDIQFFRNKERSQSEFFHVYNVLVDDGKQIIMTSDRFPKELDGLEERLKSRLGWGLTTCIEPPELETRVAILLNKAEQSQINLPQDVAFFIAKQVRSNVRELEGALKRVIANAHFTGKPISIDFARDALKDLLALQARLVTVDNIQRIVAKYYGIKVSDLLSKRRSRQIARPRQMAMTLAKELTAHSLPEIGDAFGGRDHTTVMHACKTILELIGGDEGLKEDYDNLIRVLSA